MKKKEQIIFFLELFELGTTKVLFAAKVCFYYYTVIGIVDVFQMESRKTSVRTTDELEAFDEVGHSVIIYCNNYIYTFSVLTRINIGRIYEVQQHQFRIVSFTISVKY